MFSFASFCDSRTREKIEEKTDLSSGQKLDFPMSEWRCESVDPFHLTLLATLIHKEGKIDFYPSSAFDSSEQKYNTLKIKWENDTRDELREVWCL